MCYSPRPRSSSHNARYGSSNNHHLHQTSIILSNKIFFDITLSQTQNYSAWLRTGTDHCNKYRQHYALYSQFAGMWNGEWKSKGSMLIRLLPSPWRGVYYFPRPAPKPAGYSSSLRHFSLGPGSQINRWWNTPKISYGIMEGLTFPGSRSFGRGDLDWAIIRSRTFPMGVVYHQSPPVSSRRW